MATLKTLYIDTSKSAKNALVRGISTNSPAKLDDVVLGDVIDYQILFVNGGAIDTDIAGNESYSINCEVGELGGSALALQASWGITGSYFTGSVSFNTNEITASLGTEESVDVWFEVTANDKKYLQVPLTIWNEVNASGTTPVNPSEYYTKTESDARYLEVGADLSASIFQGGNSFGSTLVVGTKDAQAVNVITNNTNYRLYIDSAGNVGIGGTGGTNKLSVTGNVSATSFTGSIQSTLANLTTANVTNLVATAGNFTNLTGSNNLFTDVNVTRLTASNAYFPNGITGSINTPLVTATDANYTRLTASNALITKATMTQFTGSGDITFVGTTANYLTKIVANKISSSAVVENSTNNIGIGTTNPTSKLHVLGNTYLQGNITSSGLFSGSNVSASNGWYNYTNTNTFYAGTGSVAGAGSTSTHFLIGASTTGKSHLRLTAGTAVSSPTNGDIWVDTTNGLQYRETVLTHHIGGTVQRQTATVTRNAATAGAQALLSPALTFPVDYLKTGQVIRVKAWGFHSVVTPPTHSVQIKLAISGAVEVVLLDFGAVTMDTTTTGGAWDAEMVMTVRSTGASGTMVADGKLNYTIGNATPTVYTKSATSAGVVTFDSTAAQALLLSVTFAGGDSSDQWICQNASVEVI